MGLSSADYDYACDLVMQIAANVLLIPLRFSGSSYGPGDVAKCFIIAILWDGRDGGQTRLR